MQTAPSTPSVKTTPPTYSSNDIYQTKEPITSTTPKVEKKVEPVTTPTN